MVDSEDHTFLCTENFLVTHNTGKKFGNEVKHADQLTLYAIALFMRDPDLEVVTAELWYLDIDDLTRITFTRKQAMQRWPQMDERFKKMCSETQWLPKPNVFNCKWCGFGPEGTGHCSVGVSQAMAPKTSVSKKR
jgi:hypothetical protein